MSVLIRGMEMPTSCSRCALFDEGSNGDPDWCNVMHQVPEYGTCPLVEIPPHGRLIDADALSEHKFVCFPRVCLDGEEVGRAYRLGWNNAIEAIMENAETIIGEE